jgi:hypothetical protein
MEIIAHRNAKLIMREELLYRNEKGLLRLEIGSVSFDLLMIYKQTDHNNEIGTAE